MQCIVQESNVIDFLTARKPIVLFSAQVQLIT